MKFKLFDHKYKIYNKAYRRGKQAGYQKGQEDAKIFYEKLIEKCYIPKEPK